MEQWRKLGAEAEVESIIGSELDLPPPAQRIGGVAMPEVKVDLTDTEQAVLDEMLGNAPTPDLRAYIEYLFKSEALDNRVRKQQRDMSQQ